MGFTHNSEDSSEFAFLLVENYYMTALYGLRIVWEFLNIYFQGIPCIFSSVRIPCEDYWRRVLQHDAGGTAIP